MNTGKEAQRKFDMSVEIDAPAEADEFRQSLDLAPRGAEFSPCAGGRLLRQE